MDLPIIQKASKYKDLTIKVLSVVGGIAIIAGVVWVGARGLVLFPSVGSALATAVASVQSLFIPAERIIVSTVDSQIVVNKPFTLTWEHRGKDTEGSYTFVYECTDGVHLVRRVASTDTTLFCNTPTPLTDGRNEITLVPVGTVDGIATVSVSIRFTENDSPFVSQEGTLSLLVQDAYLDTATSTTTTTTTTTTTSTSTQPTPTATGVVTGSVGQTITVPVIVPPFSDPNGKPDLAPRVIALGLVDTKTGSFTETNDIPYKLPSGKRGAIKFEIRNDGTKESGKWKFEIALPTSPSYTYTSTSQQSLFPGDRIEYVIGFDRIKNADEDDYRIEVDPTDSVTESNEKNNVKTGVVEIDR
ncbi:MAG: hypothetical protein NUW02_03390 [Candidatus Campbellbacteria bacterium]|nr:hypothetical protein [Candidatus Campbellbacteria bacterium]